jgi:hypothetical protein
MLRRSHYQCQELRNPSKPIGAPTLLTGRLSFLLGFAKNPWILGRPPWVGLYRTLLGLSDCATTVMGSWEIILVYAHYEARWRCWKVDSYLFRLVQNTVQSRWRTVGSSMLRFYAWVQALVRCMSECQNVAASERQKRQKCQKCQECQNVRNRNGRTSESALNCPKRLIDNWT